jgi:hypothetical protein
MLAVTPAKQASQISYLRPYLSQGEEGVGNLLATQYVLGLVPLQAQPQQPHGAVS